MPKNIITNLVVLIKFTFFGVLLAEAFYFSGAISEQLNKELVGQNKEILTICLSLIGLIVTLLYLWQREFYSNLKKLLKSCRFDVFIAFCFGIWLSVAWGGFLSNWYEELAAGFNFQQLLTIVITPFLVVGSVFIRSISSNKNRSDSSLLSDKEIDENADDLLNFTETANKFAGRVFNNGATESFVFGIDAPWGIGKSSFVNLCEKYWERHHKDETIIYKFNPLRYAGNDNLLEIFINGLIHSIQKDSFIPEIRPLISRYSRLLREVDRFSIFGFKLPNLTANYTADEAFDDLSTVLEQFDKKVIIVVDDLDRMNFSEIKDILFAIRKSFVLPNLSYVLCYDTENIGILEAETLVSDKISEFLEKFINIKISLFLDKEDLAKYVSENLDKAISTKFVDPMLVRQAIGGLLDIYKSSEYHKYLPFVGDIRKLKRLINTIVLFELENTDFNNSDFNKHDLIHLLLIYIHYPNVFRKIYDAETKGGHGFFSLVTRYDDGYPKEEPRQPGTSFSDSEYKNSTYYSSYIKQFPETSHQRFLLDRIFNVNIRFSKDSEYTGSARTSDIPQSVRSSYACFNGSWGNSRNLEAYLKLIVELSKPEDTTQYKFYENWKNKIVSGEKTIEEVFKDSKFDCNEGEFTRESLLRIIVNNARSLSSPFSDRVIVYLLDNIHHYSYIEIDNVGVGLRKDIDYFLTRLLNDAGWSDESGNHSGNTEENIKEIAEWIFGEGRHVNNGVLDKLSSPARGVLGLYDLMVFRLYCSADRGGDIFDLSRALSKHYSPNAPTEGKTHDIAKDEMREISQKVFSIFKTQYIDSARNIFAEISKLDLENLSGRYKGYLEIQVRVGKLSQDDLDKQIATLKSNIASFIIYQLGNSMINSGVGCGYYDPTGSKDEHLIAEAINDYLFDICFEPSTPGNFEYFIDYLLANYARVFGSASEDGRSRYVPNINEFTKVLNKTKLITYWETNSSTIKAMNLDKKEKNLYVGNYVAAYEEDLPALFEVLDAYKKEMETTDTAIEE